MTTTIKLRENTKHNLDRYREYGSESYDEVVKKLIYIADNVKKKPELSKETVDDIEKARSRIAKGRFLTEEEAKKRLGIHV